VFEMLEFKNVKIAMFSCLLTVGAASAVSAAAPTDINVTSASVPEPGPIGILCIGMAALYMARRKRIAYKTFKMERFQNRIGEVDPVFLWPCCTCQ
jgi:threonine dehydrogenase-like Zn-dependent dehydrogenase